MASGKATIADPDVSIRTKSIVPSTLITIMLHLNVPSTINTLEVIGEGTIPDGALELPKLRQARRDIHGR